MSEKQEIYGWYTSVNEGEENTICRLPGQGMGCLVEAGEADEVVAYCDTIRDDNIGSTYERLRRGESALPHDGVEIVESTPLTVEFVSNISGVELPIHSYTSVEDGKSA